MTRSFRTFDEYFAVEPQVAVQSLDLGGVVVSSLTESSNDIAVASVGMDALLLSVSGSAHHRVRIGDRLQDAPTRPDDVALVPKGVALTSSWRVRERKLHTVSVEFDQSLFTCFAPEVVTDRFSEGHLVPTNYSRQDGLAAVTGLIAQELDTKNRRGRLFGDTLKRLLALSIAPTFWSTGAPVVAPRLRVDRRVRRAIDLIEERFTEDMSMLDLASASGIGVSALTAQFRKVTGKSPYAYVIDRRLAHAEALLRSTDIPLAEVALASGFCDQSHLTRTLRSRRGVTPRAIRIGG